MSTLAVLAACGQQTTPTPPTNTAAPVTTVPTATSVPLATVTTVPVPTAVPTQPPTQTAPAAKATQPTTITVYSGQHEQTMTMLVADFQRSNDVQVQVRSDNEATLANQILQEGSHSPADVFVAENPPALTLLDARGLLAPVDSATLAAVPRKDSSEAGNWVGVSGRTAALVYNRDLVQPSQLPKSVRDVAGASWKGRVGFAPTETDFLPVVAALMKLDGEDAARRWLTDLKDNGKIFDDNEALVVAVNKGDIAAGLIDHYYWYRMRDEAGSGNLRSALHFYAPGDPGNLVDISGAAILKSSKNQSTAQRFLAYLVSEPAQKIIATSESYEYPLRPGVANSRLEQSFDQLRPPQLSAADLGDGAAALRLLQQVGVL